MLRPRIIPCLLIHNKGLYKTVNFKNHKYVGDPLNAVKIFNEKEVDELFVLDIDATVEQRSPDFSLIENLAAECRMPFCYGGGVTSVEQAKKIIELGAEKVAISSSVVDNLSFVKDLSVSIGSQSVVVVLDVKKKQGLFKKGHEIFTHNGQKKAKVDLLSLVESLNQLNIGELVINSIDNDGKMNGYDMDLAEKIRSHIDVPLTILGGAGSIRDIELLISKFEIIGASAGSLFVFKGKYRAVLINYPTREEKEKLLLS
ncbi:MAG: AglZ/HisF2 family acetamidino modification protein [Cyclobacteriaceae bacterium]